MRNKLQTFTDFANRLLPHETAYLLSIQQFQDKERLDILTQIDTNCQYIKLPIVFNEQIDKRKYSHLKIWIEERLQHIDVDFQYNRIMQWHQHLITDTIAPNEEKALLKTIELQISNIKVVKHLDFPNHKFQIEYPLNMDFYFVKFYELVKDFRQYLIIRMRYTEHEVADNFIKTNEKKYQYCRTVSDKMYEATRDIVNQYAQKEATETVLWEEWLTERFYDENLDGMNRYFALVRLTFIYNNYRQFDKLKDKYDHIDALFRQGFYYSKRLLANYYSNRLLLHTRFKEFSKAEYYGYLSIRVKNSDYLQYVNNLCAILLREKKNEAALKLMREAHPELKHTQSFHNKVGYMAFYCKCLNVNGLWRESESYIESFLNVYKTEVFEQRWHIFFTTYLESLLGQNKYVKSLQIIKRFKLLEKEKQYRKKISHLPTMLLYNALCEYKEAIIGFNDLKKIFASEKKAFSELSDTSYQFEGIMNNILNNLTKTDKLKLLQ